MFNKKSLPKTFRAREPVDAMGGKVVVQAMDLEQYLAVGKAESKLFKTLAECVLVPENENSESLVPAYDEQQWSDYSSMGGGKEECLVLFEHINRVSSNIFGTTVEKN